MGKDKEGDDLHPQNVEFSKGGDNDLSNGPVTNRGCTDIIFLILFILHWVVAIGLSVPGFTKGNPVRIIAARDVNGAFCGLDEYKDHKIGYFSANLDKIVGTDATTIPSQTQLVGVISTKNFNQLLDYFQIVCVKECPKNDNEVAEGDRDYSYPEGSTIAVDFQALSLENCPYEPKYCVPLPIKSRNFLGRYCLPDHESVNLNPIPEGWLNLGPYFGDLLISWPVVVSSLFIALAAGILVLVLLRFIAGCLVWGMIFLTFALLAGGGYGLFWYARSGALDYDNSLRWGVEICAYVLWAFSVVYLLLICCMFSRIRLGIAINKTAAMFMYNVPAVLVIPPVIFLVVTSFYVLWIVCVSYILSAVDENQGDKRFQWDENTQYTFWYLVFSLCWSQAFFIGMNQMIIAGAVGIWYFTSPNEFGSKFTPGAPCRAACTAFRYHMGSVAFGGLILAIVQTIKWFLTYLAKNAEASHNVVMACVFKCLAYCVWCFEKCIKFLNKNAYIQCALMGKNFCRSAKAAFYLIWRNLARIAILGGIGSAFSLFGKLCITAAAGTASYFMLTSLYGDDISSPVFPTVVCVIGAYVVAAIIMDVYALSVDSILQCFVIDEEMSGKSEGSAAGGEYTPEPLRAFIKDHGYSNAGGCCCCK